MFDKSLYWERRNKKLRGQIDETLATKNVLGGLDGSLKPVSVKATRKKTKRWRKAEARVSHNN